MTRCRRLGRRLQWAPRTPSEQEPEYALAKHVHDASLSRREPHITVTSFSTATRTLALADNNTILMSTAASHVEVAVTIPTDATLNLPVGFTVTLLNRSALEAWFLPQVDFYPSPWDGTPNMFYLSEGTGPDAFRGLTASPAARSPRSRWARTCGGLAAI